MQSICDKRMELCCLMAHQPPNVSSTIGSNSACNLLSVRTDIPISRLTGVLFTLEMKGVIRAMAGGCYHLLA